MCTERPCFCCETYCCCDTVSNKLQFGSKFPKSRILEQSDDAPLEKYHKALDDAVNIKSTNTAFWTKDPTIATYGQNKRRLQRRLTEPHLGT